MTGVTHLLLLVRELSRWALATVFSGMSHLRVVIEDAELFELRGGDLGKETEQQDADETLYESQRNLGYGEDAEELTDSSLEATGCIREGKSQLEASHDVGDEVGEDHTQEDR